jgi:glutamine synthetase
MTMAGLDGVKNGVDLEANAFGPFTENVEQMAPELRARITQLPTSLPGALDALEADHEFLTAGGVFTTDVIEAWIAWKRAEFEDVNARPHPHEYSLYYDL